MPKHRPSSRRPCPRLRLLQRPAHLWLAAAARQLSQARPRARQRARARSGPTHRQTTRAAQKTPAPHLRTRPDAQRRVPVRVQSDQANRPTHRRRQRQRRLRHSSHAAAGAAKFSSSCGRVQRAAAPSSSPACGMRCGMHPHRSLASASCGADKGVWEPRSGAWADDNRRCRRNSPPVRGAASGQS